MPTRREFLSASAGVVATACAGTLRGAEELPESPTFVPTRAITRGPRFYWFGYYDKRQFDPTNRLVLSNQVDFEHRSPTADDVIRVGMIDLADGDRWTELGTSRAWGWQQGCMLQWRPGSGSEVVWNDRDGDRFVCRVHDIETGETRTLPRPVYTLSPDGAWGLSVDFARINNMRPGYGYAGVEDPHIDEKAPEESGIWRMDLDTGESQLIISLAETAAIPHNGEPLSGYWNYFNHLLASPDGSRFIFLHRWRENYNPRARTGSGFITRMFTAAADGSELYLLDPSGHTSHFIWRDPQHICAWTKPAGKPAGFYLFTDRSDEIRRVGEGVMTVNGHNTYVPQTDDEWILCDTYPQGPQRYQTPYLYHVPSGRRVDLGHFHLPPEYTGEWRCDTHPRSSNDGRLVTIDSPHAGNGRQVYLLDVSDVVG